MLISSKCNEHRTGYEQGFQRRVRVLRSQTFVWLCCDCILHRKIINYFNQHPKISLVPNDIFVAGKQSVSPQLCASYTSEFILGPSIVPL